MSKKFSNEIYGVGGLYSDIRYVSDFSDISYGSAFGGASQTKQHGVTILGEDNCLEMTATITDAPSNAGINFFTLTEKPAPIRIRITGMVYMPTGDANIDGWRVTDTSNFQDRVTLVDNALNLTGVWETFDTGWFDAKSTIMIWVNPIVGDTASNDVPLSSNGYKYYIKDFVLNRLV